ncbi:MAG: hypothetical protein ACLR6Z_05030 [Dorea sp.]
MKKHKVIFRILLIVICCMCFTVTGYARAGGGGSSGGSGGGSGSSSGSGSHSHYYRQGGRRGGPVEMIIWWGTFICMARSRNDSVSLWNSKSKAKEPAFYEII